MEHVFSVEAMVRGYHSTRRLGMHLLVVKERWQGNIHSTFAVVITKDGEGSHRCRLSLYFSSFLSNF